MMAIKRKDFQKTSSIILEFLLKLPDEETSARLRDTLLHGLHFLQQYYLILQKRDKEQKPLQWTIERGLSPLTPFREAPDKFEWPWIDVESNKVKQTVPKHSLNNFVNLPPIIVAVREGDLRYVKELLNTEPDLIDRVDSFGRDLLTYAVQYQQLNILRYLLLERQPPANINSLANDGSTCLHRACYGDGGQHCNVELVRLLLENHADVSIQDVHLRSPLHWAVLAENIDCLQILLEYNANVHIKDIDGMTPAMWACHLDRYAHFQELSHYIGDTIEKDNDGRTYIHYSARKTEPLECLKALLSPQTMQIRDNEGRTCLHVAAEQGSVFACRYIFEMGDRTGNRMYVHDGDNDRQTPLHLATKNGHARVLKELLDHGADPHIRDIHGISPLDYAQNRGLYFCRSVFEVYLRDKRGSGFDSRPSTTRSFLTSTIMNGSDVAPAPPINGHASFIRRNGRRSFTDSLPPASRASPTPSNDPFSRTATYPMTSSILSNRNVHTVDGEEDNEDENHRQRYRPSSSTASIISTAPPVKPRKSSTAQSKEQQQQQQQPITVTSVRSDEDDDDNPNSLEGHGGQSDLDDEQQSKQERPNSRLALRNGDDRLQPSTNTVVLRRPQYKPTRQHNRHSMYDDYRFLDEQQQQQPPPPPPPMTKSKQPIRSMATKEFSNPPSNRVGSGSGNQSATNRLKSGSKSSSTESIPALDLTVAGQKVFRTKQQQQQPADAFLTSSLPLPSTMRPPSGRLKPISSAKSTSSYTDEFSSGTPSLKTLEDVTNNVKQPPSPTRTHLYKKKLAPLINGNDNTMKKYSYRPLNDQQQQQQFIVDDVPSDRSEETSGGGGGGSSGGGGGGRDVKSSSGSDKRSKYH